MFFRIFRKHLKTTNNSRDSYGSNHPSCHTTHTSPLSPTARNISPCVYVRRRINNWHRILDFSMNTLNSSHPYANNFRHRVNLSNSGTYSSNSFRHSQSRTKNPAKTVDKAVFNVFFKNFEFSQIFNDRFVAFI